MIAMTVQSLRPGQTLAKPVLNQNGTMMLGEGTQLTEQYIERLRKTAQNFAIFYIPLPCYNEKRRCNEDGESLAHLPVVDGVFDVGIDHEGPAIVVCLSCF